MNKKNYHVKKFEETYSQSREAQLIQHLNQRGAQVPKLISNHPTKKIIKMEHVGESLLTIFNDKNNEEKINAIKVLKILRESISVGQEISRLEVWHFDLAFRNFTFLQSEKSISKSIFLIDFSAAISPSFLLQKPLWLRPDTKLHHSELVRALEKDWINFFRRNSLNVPKIIDNEFTIPIDIYNNYWNPQLYVQKLSNPVCVVSHSIGIMIYNFLNNSSSFLPEIKKNKLEELIKITNGLKDLRSSAVAYSNISKLIQNLNLIIQDLEISSGVTPRPTISVDIYGHKKNTIKSKYFKFMNFNGEIKKNILALFIIFFGFFVTNQAYIYQNILLGNLAYKIALTAISLPMLYIFLTLLTWTIYNLFKVFLRLEAMILLYYFFELLYRDSSWIFSSLILISAISSFGLTTKFKKSFN